MDPVLTTLLTAPAIVALVNIARGLGLPSKLAPIGAVLLGVLLAVLDQTLGAFPAYQAATSGALLGLAASGVYDVSKLAAGRQTIEIGGGIVEVETGQNVGTFSRTIDLEAPASCDD